MSRSRLPRQTSTVNQVPLGSLTQRDNRHGAVCVECGSPRVTRLAMSLTGSLAWAFAVLALALVVYGVTIVTAIASGSWFRR